MQNNLISQASHMRMGGTPNDLLPAMNQVGCIVFGPMIQDVLYPFLHRRNIYPSAIARITAGYAFVTMAMLYATVLQFFIDKTSSCNDSPGRCNYSQIHVWLQAPVFLFLAVGEILAVVTGMEYAYSQAPQGAKVLVQAVGLLVAAFASGIALSLSVVAHDPNMVVFYGSLTATMAATTIAFWLLFRVGASAARCAGMGRPVDATSDTVSTQSVDFDQSS